MPKTFYHELTSIYGHIICTCGEQFHYSDVGERLCPQCGKAYTVIENAFLTFVEEAVITPSEQATIDKNTKMLTGFSLILKSFQHSLIKQGFTREEAYDLTRDWWVMQLGKLDM